MSEARRGGYRSTPHGLSVFMGLAPCPGYPLEFPWCGLPGVALRACLCIRAFEPLGCCGLRRLWCREGYVVVNVLFLYSENTILLIG